MYHINLFFETNIFVCDFWWRNLCSPQSNSRKEKNATFKACWKVCRLTLYFSKLCLFLWPGKNPRRKVNATLNEDLKTVLQAKHWHGNLCSRQQQDTEVQTGIACLVLLVLYLHYVTWLKGNRLKQRRRVFWARQEVMNLATAPGVFRSTWVKPSRCFIVAVSCSAVFFIFPALFVLLCDTVLRWFALPPAQQEGHEFGTFLCAVMFSLCLCRFSHCPKKMCVRWKFSIRKGF